MRRRSRTDISQCLIPMSDFCRMERAIAIASIVCTIRAGDTRKFEARICSCDWDFEQTYMDRNVGE